MNNLAEQSLASIVTEQFQSAQVFEKYNLDFCCKGKKTLAAACEDNGLSIDEIIEELNVVLDKKNDVKNFNDMSAEELISYIILHHHFFVKQSLPNILSHIEKVVYKHGTNYPYMVEVLNLFQQVNDEMLEHMQKEELILFPKIREIEANKKFNKHIDTRVETLLQPIEVMEMEHEFVGEALNKIKTLTNHYTILDEMCTTFKITINELKEFEENLHQHVHLENNILFPMAKLMLQ
jgi:regulator of cell morphogenesis and NO signaling